jgi:hypothetical protein
MGGAAAVAASHLPVAMAAPVAPAPAAAAHTRASRVSLAGGNDRADIAFKSLEPFKDEIAAAIGNKRVILKPNNVIINVPLCATNAENLEGILEFLKSIGKTNVIIAESPAGGSVMDGFANYGYNRLAKKYNVKLVNLDAEKVEIVQCIDEKDFQPHAVRVAKIMMDPANNFVISAAKLKTHDLVGITLSLKNVVIGAGTCECGAGRRQVGQAPDAWRRNARHQLQHIHAVQRSAPASGGHRRIRGHGGHRAGAWHGDQPEGLCCQPGLAGCGPRGRGADGSRRQQDWLPELLHQGGQSRPGRPEQDPDRWAADQELRQELSTAEHMATDHIVAEADGGKLSWNEKQDTGRGRLWRLRCRLRNIPNSS